MPSWILVASWRPGWRTRVFAALADGVEGAVIDVGVNVGQSLLDVLTVDKERPYIGFEPNPFCATFVERLIALNNLTSHHVIATSLANEAGIARYWRHRFLRYDMSAALEPYRRLWRDEVVGYVPKLAFDDIAAALPVPKLALVKIDAEGAETDILSGMRGTLAAQRCPVVCEVLDRDRRSDSEAHRARLADLSRTLRVLGYSIYPVNKQPGWTGLGPPLDEFPARTWSRLTAHMCDYVFLPTESASRYLRRFPTAR